MTDLALYAYGAVSVIFGGVVKGAIGVGLPLMVIPLMSLVIPSPQAIGLMVAPVLVSNIYQAIDTGLIRQSAKRFMPLLITQTIASILTVKMTLALSIKQLNMMLAGAVVLAVVLMSFKPKFSVSPKAESWASAGVGLFSGLLGGISSLTGPIIITYLMALQLKKEEFVGAISVVYFCAAVPMYAAMFWYGRIGWSDLIASCIALAPMFIGLALGKRIRAKLNEDLFRKFLFGFLLLLAVLLLFR